MGTIVEPLQMETINPAISCLAVFIAGIAYCRIKSLNFSLDRFRGTRYDLGGGIMEAKAPENKNLMQHMVEDFLAVTLLLFSCTMFYLCLYML
jgi:hypothetical protein